MIRRPPRSTRTDTSFPTRRSSDLAVALDQPRAIALSAEAMHIGTAGDNRIWTYNLGKRELRLLAGSGALGVSDGSGNRASFAQPVGLVTVQQMLYACDAAGSAIRSVNARSGQVTTLLGQDTWNFGKADGARVDRKSTRLNSSH